MDGQAPEIDAAAFVSTYILTADAFYDFLQYENARLPNNPPDPPIIDAMGNTLDKAAMELAGPIISRARNYLSGILEPFLSYDRKTEQYIITAMKNNAVLPEGYSVVIVELLYGSHSAEVRMSLISNKGEFVQFDPISTQGYNTILDMNTYFDSIEKQGGVIQSVRYAVGWGYSFED